MNQPSKILHIADTHCFQKKRHVEFKEVTEALCKLIQKEKVDIVYIGGDVIDSKARLTPEQIETVTYFFYQISNLVPIIMIPGNHDCDLRQKDSLDSLTPIVDNIASIHPIYYLKNSGIYNLYNINWVVWSCLDNKNPLENLNLDDTYRIGCYHGAIAGGKTDSNWTMSGEIEIDTFKNCQSVFLGDLHLQQDFRNKEIAYPGSWYQVKVDEVEDKGCLIWEWNNNENKYVYKFHKLENRFGFKTYEIKDIDTFDETSITAPSDNFLIRLLYTGHENKYSAIKFYEIKKRLKHKLTNEVILQKRFKKQTSVKEIKEKISDKTDFLQLFYKKKGLPQAEIDQISQIDALFNKRIDTTDYQTGEYFIQEVEIENFLCFGENNMINFSSIQGLVGLFCQNKTGKSSLLESIVFCLFNKSVKSAKSVANLINDQTPDGTKAFVQVKLEINGSLWRIKRTIIPNTSGAKIKLEVYETVEGLEVPRHEESRTKTDASVLRKLLGDEKIFLTTVLSDLANSVEFVKSKNAERLDLVINFLGITVYDQKLKLCDEDIKKFGYEHEILKKELEKLVSPYELEEKKQELLLEIKTTEQNVLDTTIAINNYVEKIAKYKEKIKNLNIIGVNKTLIELKKDLKTFLSDLDIKESQLKENIKNQNSFKKQWLKNDKTEDKSFDEWKINHSKHDKEKEVISQLKNDIKNLKSKLDSETCPTCSQIWHKIDRVEVEKAIIEKNKAIIELQTIISNWNSAQEELTTLQINIKQLANSIELSAAKIETLKNKKEVVLQQIKIVNDNKIKISKREGYETAIIDLTEKLEKEKTIKQKYEANKVYATKELVVIATNIKNYNEKFDKIKEHEALTKGLVLYKDGVHRTGIPSLILETYIPAINEEINSQINDLFELNVKFELIGDQLEVVFYYDEFENGGKGKRDITQASGMEGTVINLAIRAALSKISLLPKPSFLMLDEIFNTLDKDNIEQIKPYLLRLKEQYYNIIIISHLDTVKDLPSNFIQLERIDGITTILSI
jgi:DNA repair exonuclease SbcCD nuclease subunit